MPLDFNAIADALAAGEIDCGNLFSTGTRITTDGFVALDDDKGAVPNEAVLPLVRSEVVDDDADRRRSTTSTASSTPTR